MTVKPDDPDVIGIDVEAIQQTVESLPENVRVTGIDSIERDDDGLVGWTMELEAETRTAKLDDFTPEDD